MCVYIRAFKFVFMCLWQRLSREKEVRTYMYVYVCEDETVNRHKEVRLRMYVCIHMCVYVWSGCQQKQRGEPMDVCVYVCMCVCVFVCVCG